MAPPTLTILAGPNGAGKTTFANKYLELVEGGAFLNADEVARTISPSDPGSVAVAAGRRILNLRRELMAAGKAFVIESTLASKTLLSAIPSIKKEGYRVDLQYLWISNPEICDIRVKTRVTRGGHDIPTSVIFRRYEKSVALLGAYLDEVHTATIYLADEMPREIVHDRVPRRGVRAAMASRSPACRAGLVREPRRAA